MLDETLGNTDTRGETEVGCGIRHRRGDMLHGCCGNVLTVQKRSPVAIWDDILLESCLYIYLPPAIGVICRAQQIDPRIDRFRFETLREYADCSLSVGEKRALRNLKVTDW